METPAENKNIYELFRISILLKGAISLLEVVAGIVILFIPPSLILRAATFLTNSELAEEQHDFIASHLLQLAQQFTADTATFVSIYLLSRGLVKVFLIWALLKNKLWAYPASLVVLGLFVVYQIYQIITTHSFIVIGITIFDLFVMYFIWREYQIVRDQRKNTA
ncbi:DUF2127 domain-containing protein [Patescibacteria group bacterium]|nr:DUF2127 domain-containing protein [Patescibacteria group bacterium]